MLQLRTINKVFREDGLPLELVKGEGYLYYVYDRTVDNRLVFEDEMVYVYRLNNQTFDRWIEDGRRFALEVEHRHGINR